MSSRARQRIVALALVGTALATLGSPLTVAAVPMSTAGNLRADLDGRMIDPRRVSEYFCEDFAYPQIHCYSSSKALERHIAAVLSGVTILDGVASHSTLSASSIDYVTIYDYPSYAGSYMYLSQDYSILASIGWNDKISSFIARNGQEGHFYTDWFYSGTSDYFCCNEMDPILYSFDNTFSSVHRD